MNTIGLWFVLTGDDIEVSCGHYDGHYDAWRDHLRQEEEAAALAAWKKSMVDYW